MHLTITQCLCIPSFLVRHANLSCIYIGKLNGYLNNSAVMGPKLGARAMVQSRFSWGYYGAIIPSILNVLSMQGYVIINCIIGGQTLAAVSPHLDPTAGIVITGLISLGVSMIYLFIVFAETHCTGLRSLFAGTKYSTGE